LNYLKQCQEIGEVTRDHTPTLNLMRTREARNSDLTHTEVTAMCYELAIPTTLQWDAETKRVRQCVPAGQTVRLQAAIQRYYARYKRR
jgi:YD repeat-containing protein